MTRSEEVKRALIKALVDLLNSRGIDAISVREIAKAAGVNHGLVHRHFGSKENLVREAFGQVSDEIHRGDPGGSGISAWSFDYIRRHPELVAILVRTCLDGPHDLLQKAAPDQQRLAEIVAPIQAGLEKIGLGSKEEAHLLNALATAAFLGWFAFRPLLEQGMGLPADADDRMAKLLGTLDTFLSTFSS